MATSTGSGYVTAAQVEQFNEQGYLVIPAAFDDAEVGRMRREADYILQLIINSSLANKRQSRRLDWRRQPDTKVQVVRKIQPINDLSLYFAEVSADPRLVEPMRTIMGDEPILMEEKLNYKQPLPADVQDIPIREFADSFPVHHDWAYYASQNYPQSILSSAISLDPSTEDNGPLRVWPGSHKTMLESRSCDNGLEVHPDLIDHDGGIDVIAPAGSVMIFHSLLVHNSKPNMSGKPRRIMIYSHYPKAADMGHDIRNGPARLRETPWERQYYRMKDTGVFKDVFKAPTYEGREANPQDTWVSPPKT